MIAQTRTTSTSRRFADAIALEIEAACGVARGLSVSVDLFKNTDLKDLSADRSVKVSIIPQGCGIKRHTRVDLEKTPECLMVVQARAADLDGAEPEEFVAVAEELAGVLLAAGTVGDFAVMSAVTNGAFIKEDFETAGVISVPVSVTGMTFESVTRVGTGATTR
jgi:hypothetical protein